MSASVKASCSSNEQAEEKTPKFEESRIPVLSPTHFRRTGSLKLRNEIRAARNKSDSSSTLTQPLRRHRSLQGLTSPVLTRPVGKNYERDDDVDSERSFGSSCNSLCGHSPFAHNGTTYSTRNMKYIFHCSPSTGSDEYLTPTQRTNRTIKRLRRESIGATDSHLQRMLGDAQAELLEKDKEIDRLMKEIVELRLLKVDNVDENDSCLKGIDPDLTEPIFNKSGPRYMGVLLEERDGLSIAEKNESNGFYFHEVSNNKGDFPRRIHSPSLDDSGNFEDINVTHSLEKEIERMRQNYDDMREKHNEKVEHLLKIISDSNDRYYEMKPKYDSAVIRMKELEKEIETLKSASLKQEELQRNFYLQLFSKQLNSETVMFGVDKDLSITEERKQDDAENVADLLENLSVTRKELENVKDVDFKNNVLLSAREAISLWILGTRKAMYRALLDASKLKTGNDAEMTLRFLRTAIFYFLTDTTNSRDHLAAIESILEFSDDEKAKIEKIQAWK